MTETPRVRDWLIGQDAVFEKLDRAMREDRIAHAYLLLGPKGGGRTRLGIAFAQQLLCTDPTPPCGTCGGCRRTAHLSHPDLHLVVPLSRDELDDPERVAKELETWATRRYHTLGLGATASIGIDRVRDLKMEAAKARVEGSRRVIILTNAGRMTEQAAQSALKLVEEPPPRTVLILIAEDPAQLLPTLVSRCQRLLVRPLGRDALCGILERELDVPAASARVLAGLSGGALGRALEMHEGQALAWRDRVFEVFDLGPGRESAARLQEVERRVQRLERAWNPESAKRAVELLLFWYRDLLAARSGLGESELVHADRAADAIRTARTLSIEEIGHRIRVVEEMSEAIEQYVNPALALHAALSRLGTGEEGAAFPV